MTSYEKTLLSRGLVWGLIGGAFFTVSYCSRAYTQGNNNDNLQQLLSPPHIHGQDGVPTWYDEDCCTQKDCHSVQAPDTVEEVNDIEVTTLDPDVDEGLYVTGKVSGWKYTRTSDGVIGIYTKNQIKASQDGRFHVCHSANVRATKDGLQFGSTYCIYIPTTA